MKKTDISPNLHFHLHLMPTQADTSGIPNYNIIKLANEETIIEIDLVGLTDDDIFITKKKNTIILSADQTTCYPKSDYVYHGAYFQKKYYCYFTLPINIEIREVTFFNGRLAFSFAPSDDIEQVIPVRSYNSHDTIFLRE
jgi:HSP20 family molecular chaperone IbpA